MDLKYHKLFIHDHLNSRVFSESYTSDASEKGQLFIIFESLKTKIDQQPLIDQIIDEATTYFYEAQNSQTNDPELILEEVLQKINQLLPELNTAPKIKTWLANIDLAIGMIYEDNIYISSIGNINALLLHSNQFTTIISKNNEINLTKLFSDIISGQLDQGDVLIISTNSLFDYISKEKIKQLVKRYSPPSAVIKIKQLLETVPDFVTLNSLIIKKSNGLDAELKEEKINSETETSVQDISDSQKQTSNKQTKRGTNVPRTKWVIDLKAFKNVNFLKKFQGLVSSTKLFFVIIKKVVVFIWQRVKDGFLFLASNQYRHKKEVKTIDRITTTASRKYNWFSRLNLKKKIALIGLLIIFLVFMQTLVFLTQKRSEKQKDVDYYNSIQEINIKFTEAESKLIYNDEQAAENLLLEINQIIEKLIIHSAEQQKEVDVIKDQVWQQLNKVRHIYVVPSPVEIFDLSSVLENAKQIVQKDNKFYILGNNQLYVLENDQLKALIDFADGKFLADWPNTNKLILGNNNQYFIFNIDSRQIETFNFSQTAGNTSVQDLAIYSNNLYVLDPQNNQIFKYPERGESFANGSAWLNETVDLSQANSLAIDGSIYIINNNGAITKFLKGEKDAFNYHEPHPIIGSDATIKTFKDSNYLYIIDPQYKRIIILDKDGQIKDQYTSIKFDNLNDLAIDPEEKAIYLLNNNHLYLLAINE